MVIFITDKSEHSMKNFRKDALIDKTNTSVLELMPQEKLVAISFWHKYRGLE